MIKVRCFCNPYFMNPKQKTKSQIVVRKWRLFFKRSRIFIDLNSQFYLLSKIIKEANVAEESYLNRKLKKMFKTADHDQIKYSLG